MCKCVCDGLGGRWWGPGTFWQKEHLCEPWGWSLEHLQNHGSLRITERGPGEVLEQILWGLIGSPRNFGFYLYLKNHGNSEFEAGE